MKDLMGASQLAIPVVVSELRIHHAMYGCGDPKLTPSVFLEVLYFITKVMFYIL